MLLGQKSHLVAQVTMKDQDYSMGSTHYPLTQYLTYCITYVYRSPLCIFIQHLASPFWQLRTLSCTSFFGLTSWLPLSLFYSVVASFCYSFCRLFTSKLGTGCVPLSVCSLAPIFVLFWSLFLCTGVQLSAGFVYSVVVH